MTTTLLSPGTIVNEIDYSVYATQLGNIIAGMVITATRGPLNLVQLVTSVSQLHQIFGPNSPNCLGVQCAEVFLQNGGGQLQLVRVASAGTVGTSLAIVNSAGGQATLVEQALTFTATTAGVGGNSVSITFEASTPTADGSALVVSGNAVTIHVLNSSSVDRTLAQIATLFTTYPPATTSGGVITCSATTSSTPASASAPASLSGGSVPVAAIHVNASTAGSWGNALSVIIANGTQSGSSRITVLNNNTVVEAYDNLNITSTTSPNYWITRINQISQYIQITVVENNYQPAPGSYALAGGNDGTSGLVDADYIGTVNAGFPSGLQCFAGHDTVDVNIICIPGQTDQAIHSALQTCAATRQSTMWAPDAPEYLTDQQVCDFFNAANSYAATRVAWDDNQCATWYPWVSYYDSFNAVNVAIPPSVVGITQLAASAAQQEIWSAPAGLTRGQVQGAVGIDATFQLASRDLLYSSRINPIANFTGSGIVVWGQKTMTYLPTALNRINVRMLINYLEITCAAAGKILIFEPSIPKTWRRFLSLMNPIFRNVSNTDGFNPQNPAGQIDGGYLVVCDSTVNTPTTIAQNQLVGTFYVRPALTAEFIVLNFVVTAQGTTFSDPAAITSGGDS
jgi:hypothetical protein